MKGSMFLILVVLLAGCSTEPPTKPEPVTQWVLGGKEYVNWAWGYNHWATYIDSLGQIDSVRYTLGDSIWNVGTNQVYSVDEVKRLLEGSKPVGRIVSRDTLHEMLSLIPRAANGPYSDTVWRGADAGEWSSFAFLFDSASRTYRKFELNVDGDYRFTNLSLHAQRLDSIIEAVMQQSR